MLLKINPQTIHDEHNEISLFLDYIWAFLEVKKKTSPDIQDKFVLYI